MTPTTHLPELGPSDQPDLPRGGPLGSLRGRDVRPKHSAELRHVAVFLGTLAGGGAERVMINLAEAFARRGLEVDLVVARAEGPLAGDLPERLRVVDLGAHRTLAGTRPLARYLRRKEPDALFSASHAANLVALWARYVARVPTRVIASVHGTSVGEELGLAKRLVLPALLKYAYAKADGLVAVSEGVADEVAMRTGIGRGRFTVIYNPVVTDKLAPAAQEAPRHPWFGPGEPPVVIAIGRLAPEKDHASLLRAFAEVRARRRARLLILGEGDRREALEQMVRELELGGDVDLPGFRPNPYGYLARARVLVSSSRTEGLPTAVIEALALGVPVVATDCPGGIREILGGTHPDDGPLGTLVPLGNDAALADAIDSALDARTSKERTPALRARLQPFSQDSAAEAWLRCARGERT